VPDLSNGAIAAYFDELGDLYELDGAVVHRVLAYRNGAKAIRDAPLSVAKLTREGTVTQLPGIGKTLEEKIGALLETGTIPALEKLRAKFPPGLVEMTRLPGLGPKRAKKLFDELGIDSLEALRVSAESEKLRGVKGFGPKFEETVLAAFAAGIAEKPSPRFLLPKALGIAEQVIGGLEAVPGAEKVALAGSARRLADSVKDLDIIATAADPSVLTRAFGELDVIESAGGAGENAVRGRTHSGLAVDVRVVEPSQFGNLLQHFTGSRDHNMQLREAAVRRGLHVSEYGILDDATGETTRCATEHEVYERLGLAWIPPELREGRGELEAAANGGFPKLVEEDDIRGDVHSHTVASDGRNSIEEMAHAALERGYEYLAHTDHSATHGFGNHVTPDELRRQIERVRAVDAQIDGIKLLIGTETNILPDGSPDYDDDLLADLDYVVGSVHTAFQIGEAEMTKRMIRACEHPYIDQIGHPTGRKISRREPYPVDMTAVVEAAARTGTMLEINAAPDRRDLNDVHARHASAAGIPILINSDAHGVRELALVRWGIATARRAWLTADQVANTKPLDEFLALRKRVRGVTPWV
jgi:DNA polymerase (family 10)